MASFGGLIGGLGGSTLGEVLVKVGVDTTQLTTGLAKAEAESKTAGTSISKFGAVAAAGFAVAAVAAVSFAKDAIAAASEHQQALAQLEVAVGRNTAAFENQATALQNLTGYQDEEVLAADTVLARFQLTRTEIQKLIPHVLDYARATGQEAAPAAAALGKALLGNTRALKTIGISFTATGDKEKDLANITKLLTDRVGGAAEAYGKTLQGQLDIAAAKFDDLKESIGNALIPVVISATNDISGLIDELVRIPSASDDAATGVTGLQKGAAILALGIHAVLHPLDTLVHGFSIDIPTGSAAAQHALDLVTQAMKDQREAGKALAGGLVGLVASVDQLKAAQHDLNKTRNDAEATAAELRSAELNVLQAQLGVTGSLKDLVQKQRDAGASSADIIEKFTAMATKAGLTKKEIQSLTDFVQRYIDKLNAVPTSVNTNFTASGVPHLAHGFHGMVSSPTMFLAGEAGPERVDVTPQGQSSRGGGGRGGGSGFTVNINQPRDRGEDLKQNLEWWWRTHRGA